MIIPLVRLGWRNVWRNRRRSVITILAVAFAVMFSIAMRGVQLGTYEVNIQHVVGLFSGHLQVQREGYQQNPSLEKCFRITPPLDSLLHDCRPIVSWAPRIVGDGLVSCYENSVGAMIIGIDPQRERAVSQIMSRVSDGRFFDSDSLSEIVVGQQMLRNLKSGIGGEVVVLAQGYDGSLGNLKFRIAGAIKTGFPEFDGAILFMGLSAAQELFAMSGRVHLLAIRLRELDDVPNARERLNESLRGTSLAALAWNQVMPDFEQSIQLDNVSGMLFLALLIIIVAFGITNTVLMSVTERFREFGVLLALGMKNRTLVVVVFAETIIIVTVGLLVGNLLAWAVNYYLVQNPIVFGGEYERIYSDYGFLPRIESSLRPSIFINSSLGTIGISLLAAIYPLIKVLRLEPLKGIRHT